MARPGKYGPPTVQSLRSLFELKRNAPFIVPTSESTSPEFASTWLISGIEDSGFESDAADYSTSLERGGWTSFGQSGAKHPHSRGCYNPRQDLAEVMPMKTLFAAILSLGLFCCSQLPAVAQDQPASAQQPSSEELDKQKAEREKNAYRLLDQVIDEAQALKLTENRVRVQISAADMLWDQNQGRARGLFAMGAEGVAEIERTSANTNRRGGPQNTAEFFGNGAV